MSVIVSRSTVSQTKHCRKDIQNLHNALFKILRIHNIEQKPHLHYPYLSGLKAAISQIYIISEKNHLCFPANWTCLDEYKQKQDDFLLVCLCIVQIIKHFWVCTRGSCISPVHSSQAQVLCEISQVTQTFSAKEDQVLQLHFLHISHGF